MNAFFGLIYTIFSSLSYAESTSNVSVTLWDASHTPAVKLAPQTVYVRQLSETGQYRFWAAKKLDGSGQLSLSLPDLPDASYLLQVISPNTGKRVSTATINAAGDYAFYVGGQGLQVSLVDAISGQSLADTRVRLYAQQSPTYWKWQADAHTNAQGQAKFDLDKLNEGIAYKLVTTVFNNITESSEPIQQAGELTFAVGSSLLTFIDGVKQQPLANQRIMLRQQQGFTSRFYRYVNTDEQGQIQLTLPDIDQGQGYVAIAHTLDDPDTAISQPILQSGTQTLTFGEPEYLPDQLVVTLTDAISGQVIADTRVRVYQYDDNQQRFTWHTDGWTNQAGVVDFRLAGLTQGERYILLTKAFNQHNANTAEITQNGAVAFAVGDTRLTLIDDNSQQAMTQERVTIRRKNGNNSDFYTYIYPDENGMVQLDLPGLAEQQAQYYIYAAPLDQADQGTLHLLTRAGQHTLRFGQQVQPSEPPALPSNTPSPAPSITPSTEPNLPTSGPTMAPSLEPNPDVEQYFSPIYPASITPPPATQLGNITLAQHWPLILPGGVISSGIPFSFGELLHESNVRVMQHGQVVQSQVRRLASWPDNSIKSLEVVVQPQTGQHAAMQLQFGQQVTTSSNAAGVTVVQGDEQWLIDTGKIQLTLAKQGQPFPRLAFDHNQNGQYEATEVQLSGGDIALVNAINQQTYRASSAPRNIVIEQQGPLKTVVKLTGELRNDEGEVLTRYIVRITALAQASSLDWEYTLIDDRHNQVYDKSPQLALSVSQYGLEWQRSQTASQVLAGIDGQVHQQDLSQPRFVHQAGQFNYDNGSFQGHDFTASGMANGAKADGWLAVNQAHSQLTVMVEDFWQNFPNEIQVSNQDLFIYLHPDRHIGQPDLTYPDHVGTQYQRPNTFYNRRPGLAKTSRFRFHFSAAALPASTLQAANDSYQRNGLNLTAPQSRYLTSGVFGQLTEADQEASTGYDAWLKYSVLNRSWQEGRPAKQYGWRDFGDRLRAGWAGVSNGVRIPSFYNDTHVGSNSHFKQYLRTQDNTWFDMAERATRHFMDIDVSHSSRSGYWKTNGPQPPGEIYALNHENIDHYARNLHTGHAHISGLTDYYLLTGDSRSREVIENIARWWQFLLQTSFTLPFDQAKYREAERDYGWPLYVMNEYVRISNDHEYHRRVAGQMMHYVMQWFDTPIARRIDGEILGINDAAQGTGYWTMTKMDNHGGTDSNGAIPWMAGALMSAMLQYHQHDQMIGSSINSDKLHDTLWQALNYLVKYGYNHDRQSFAYSEVIRSYGSGGFQLMYAMLYLDQAYQQRLSQGLIAHPEWYDTQPQWRAILQTMAQRLHDKKPGHSSQSYGFYGYEVPWPQDVWWLMQQQGLAKSD
ncbi:hypothetical protein [Motilimonas pumila]|uniref:PcRGLX/YetA-like central beta-sandwich domain-containing protein n=1 Tax=Motilimonas pumila TaxID=2303987 RepID=A0A418YE84_9GAMM|nr:hypothetical protein [Motilimonas pumila]RJG47416.1 hypothetical protein D1Z90_10915 [Motilimonas pumila]